MPAETIAGGVSGFGDQSAQRGRLTEGKQYHRDAKGIGLKHKDLIGTPWRVAFALQAAGWWLRSDIIWNKPNPMPESVTDRPARSHECLFLLAKSERYFYDAAAIAEPVVSDTKARLDRARGLTHDPPGQRPHEGQLKKRERRNRQPSADGLKASPQIEEDPESFSDTRNCRTVWTIGTRPFSGAHFATFPPEIPRRCILAGSRRGDMILDPFAGAGTTLLVADRLGRNAIGIEINREYADIALDRIRNDSPLFVDIDLSGGQGE